MAQQVAHTPRHDLSDGGHTAIVTSFVFSFLSTIAVGLRFYVRRVKSKGVFVEDWLILTALVCPSRTVDRLIGARDFQLTCL